MVSDKCVKKWRVSRRMNGWKSFGHRREKRCRMSLKRQERDDVDHQSQNSSTHRRRCKGQLGSGLQIQKVAVAPKFKGKAPASSIFVPFPSLTRLLILARHGLARFLAQS